jgi:hypothetical protein
MSFPAWLRGMLVLTLTLGAGIAIGIAFERRSDRAHADMTSHANQMVEHFTQALNLDSAQRARVAAILDQRQRSIDSTWHAIQPHVHATVDSTLREIAGVLRSDQRATFERLVQSRHPDTFRDSGSHHR